MVYLKRVCNILIFLYHFLGQSQDLQIHSALEEIEILKDSSFVTHKIVHLKKSSKRRLFPIIYDNELETLSNIKLHIIKGRRKKETTFRNLREENLELDFINSKRLKSIEIPSNSEVEISYTLSCKELMYFSSLYFFSYNNIDTLNYKIKVPNNFKFNYNTIYKDSLSFYKIDSLKNKENSIWKIKVSPQKITSNPYYYFGIYKNLKVPLMRTLVTPISYANEPKKYMNDWYLQKVSKKRDISSAVKAKIDELTTGITEPKKIINIIYNYVKTNFKYVAIEVGMGAFIPSPVNEVFKNKQGDCKDLSNFLSEVLKYKNIRSDIALASTFDHTSDCDFPSLNSANHVICVVYDNDGIILLDPTDPIHKEGFAVQSLQDRTIFIINSEGGNFYKVKKPTPKFNEIFYHLKLEVNSSTNQIKGPFSISYKGLSSNILKRDLLNFGEKEFLDYSSRFYSETFGSQSVSNLVLINNETDFKFKGEILISGKTFNDALNLYIFTDFLPKLFETEKQEQLLQGTYLGTPFLKRIKVNLTLNTPIKSFDTIFNKFEYEGMSLNLSTKFLSEKSIEYTYDFSFSDIFITEKNAKNTNKILKSFKKIINEPIMVKKKKD